MNLIEAIYRFVSSPVFDVEESKTSNNRAIQMGESFEAYVKKLLSGSIRIEAKESEIHQKKVFSFGGSKSKVPDLMYLNGPAIEIKKLENTRSDLQLNSSIPKDLLYRDDPKIAQKCLSVEGEDPWTSRDMYYVVGFVPKKTKILKELWIVDGKCYAAQAEIYNSILDDVKEAVENCGDYEFADTREVARINDVDPLKRSKLRVRGMWLITHPRLVFEEFLQTKIPKTFRLVCILKGEKYERMVEQCAFKKPDELIASYKDLPDPNNSMRTHPSVILEYNYES